MNDNPNARLELSAEEMRAIGYSVVDYLVDHFSTLGDTPVARVGRRADLEALLREPAPAEGTPFATVLQKLEQDVFSHMMRVDHPRFFAFIPVPGNFIGAMADALASGVNVFSGTWMASSGPSEIELVTLDWLRQLFGMPDAAGGLFVSGGSAANLTALAVARHVMLANDTGGAVLYCSDQTHSSNERAARVLSFAPDQLRTLPSDDSYRLPVATLREAVKEDRARGMRPFCVIANAGTTNTAAVDPLEELANFCQEAKLWLHVDGAYGAPAVLSEQGRALLRGIERADSLTVDAHKWLFQPVEAGCVIVRDRRLLRDTFHVSAAYMKDTEREAEEINFSEYGMQLTRAFRALKLWMSIKVFGLDAFRAAVTHGIELAEYAQSLLENSPHWEVVTPAQLGIVTFRYAPLQLAPERADALTSGIVPAVLADGFMMLSGTVLNGRPALRLVTNNPRTTEADIAASIARLEELLEARRTAK